MAEPNAYINYTISDIDRYLSGSMTAKEMHDIERAALQDPFLADAIEGYRERDKQQSEKHLNEITAAIQGERAETKILSLPKKKSYAWQIAASIILIAGVGFLLFNQSSSYKNETALASNDVKKEERKDSFAKRNETPALPQQDSSVALLSKPETVARQSRTEANREKEATSFKKRESAKKEESMQDATASALSPSKDDQPSSASPAPASSGYFDTDKTASARQQQVAPVMTDSVAMNSNLSEVVVTNYASRKAKISSHVNEWMTDKGKPFHLSDVEVITIGKKNNKPTDTTSVKPEGGWRSFTEYLFSRLSKKDTLAFMNSNPTNENLELEFSFDEKGAPYNIQVRQAQDSTTANEVISAVQNGPKWTSSDKKEKRLRIKY